MIGPMGQVSPEAHSEFAQREAAGERSVAVVRLLALVCFYAVELIAYFRNEVSPQLHERFTVLAAAWLLISLAVLVAQRMRVVPAWFKYAVTLADVALLTSMALIGDGPRSALVPIYFLIILSSVLRGRRSMVAGVDRSARSSSAWSMPPSSASSRCMTWRAETWPSPIAVYSVDTSV